MTFYGSDYAELESFDPDIAGVLLSELGRIRGGLQLIASENLSSPRVLTALGSTLSNKYAEGYPGRRYYGGCAEVDKAENRSRSSAARISSAPITPMSSRTVGARALTRRSTVLSSSRARPSSR
jgi:glycine hydroxymethyltransferase